MSKLFSLYWKLTCVSGTPSWSLSSHAAGFASLSTRRSRAVLHSADRRDVNPVDEGKQRRLWCIQMTFIQTWNGNTFCAVTVHMAFAQRLICCFEIIMIIIIMFFQCSRLRHFSKCKRKKSLQQKGEFNHHSVNNLNSRHNNILMSNSFSISSTSYFFAECEKFTQGDLKIPSAQCKLHLYPTAAQSMAARLNDRPRPYWADTIEHIGRNTENHLAEQRTAQVTFWENVTGTCQREKKRKKKKRIKKIPFLAECSWHYAAGQESKGVRTKKNKLKKIKNKPRRYIAKWGLSLENVRFHHI